MDRYYRGSCEHGLWVALLHDEAALAPDVPITCPHGCVITLETAEAPPT